MKDPNPTFFTNEEKLDLIEKGLMDPAEMGLTCKPSELPAVMGEAPKILPPAVTVPKLGNWLTFEASPVPPDIRAMWAKQDAVIIPFDVEAYKEQIKDEALIQVIFRCGNLQAKLEQLVKADALHEGFAMMLEKAAAALRDFKTATEPKPEGKNEPNSDQT
jgi:hypothetical protein